MPSDDITTIGTVGADYLTLNLWEAGEIAGRNLVTDDVRVIGRIITQLSLSSSFGISPATAVDATRYIILESLTRQEVRLSANITTTIISTNENYTRVRGFNVNGNGFDCEQGLSASDGNIYVYLMKVWDIGRSQARGILITKDNIKVMNNIVYLVRGSGSSGEGIGIKDQTASFTNYIVQNTVDDIQTASNFGNCYGISTSDNINKHVYGNIVTRSAITGGGSGTVLDYEQNAPVSADYQHNSSEDASASGIGSIINNLPGNIFVDHTTRNYHEKNISSTINAGGNPITQYGAIFNGWNTDMDNVTRPQDVNYDMGAYELIADTQIEKNAICPPRRNRRARIFL